MLCPSYYGIGEEATFAFWMGVAQRAELVFRHGLTEDFESHTHHVLMQLMLLFRSEDFREGIQSFMEKREPHFEGR